MNATQLIEKHYIDPIIRPQTGIGVEIELPLVSIQGNAIKSAFISKLAKHIEDLNFLPIRSTLDGEDVEWINEAGDICSFETTWNTLEFSMKNETALKEIANRFYPILIDLQEFCMENGYYLCGRGINPNSVNINTAPLRTPILLAKSDYLKKYTRHHDGEIFHAICASVQTHLDAVSAEQYIDRFNLLRRAYVFDALFFANSMLPDNYINKYHPVLKGINQDTLCFRDELWRYCDAPNTEAFPGSFRDTHELCRYLADLKLFILPDGDDFCSIQPIAFSTYCEQTDNGESALRCFRSLEPVSPTQSGTLELRSTCTQPLDKLFAPSAFYLGLVENHCLAKRKIDDIYHFYFSEHSPLEVRDKLMKRSNHMLRQQLKDEGMELLDIAYNGLANRGCADEQFLLPLKELFYAKDECLFAQHNVEDAALQQARQQMDVIRREYQ